METKVNDKTIIELVFKSLCHILKTRKIYHKFRCFIGNGNMNNNNTFTANSIYSSFDCMKAICKIAENDSSQNPFYFTSTLNDIYEVMSHTCSKKIITSKTINGKIQVQITQLINGLIHYCVEKSVKDFRVLEQIGQETFDLVCSQLFGKDFVDETEENMPNDMRKMVEAQKKFMEFSGMQDPMSIMQSTDFLRFLKERGYISEHNGLRREETWDMLTMDEDEEDYI